MKILLAILATTQIGLAQDRIPERAYQYRAVLHAELERTWGLHLPEDVVGVSAGTIHQESAWNPLAQSPYAKGLTQFTDATWANLARISGVPSDPAGVWNPQLAIRLMTVYHNRLWSSIVSSTRPSDIWAFVLSAYNGGPGWVTRDQKKCASTLSCDPRLWWQNTEKYNAGRSTAAFTENRGYPRAIIKRWLPLYRGF